MGNTGRDEHLMHSRRSIEAGSVSLCTDGAERQRCCNSLPGFQLGVYGPPSNAGTETAWNGMCEDEYRGGRLPTVTLGAMIDNR